MVGYFRSVLFTCNDSPTWKVRARISVVPPRGIPLSVTYIPFGNPNASFWEWSGSTKKLYGWRVRWVVGCCRLFACLVACRLRDWIEDTVMWVYRLSDIRIARMRPGTRPINTDNEYNVFTRCFEVQNTIITFISVFIQNTIRTQTTV